MNRPYFDPVLSGRKMRSIRKARNISVEQVREYMGFESVQAIYKWERGECFPQADTLIALSLFYHVNPIELFEEDAKASSYLCLLFGVTLKCLQTSVGDAIIFQNVDESRKHNSKMLI